MLTTEFNMGNYCVPVTSVPDMICSEMEKRADTADISVLFFFGCANILAVNAQTS